MFLQEENLRCKVISNADPLRQGRLRVEHPRINNGAAIWIKGVTPFGGFNSGMVHLPPPGCEVLLLKAKDLNSAREWYWFAVVQGNNVSRNEKYENDADSTEDPGLTLRSSIPETDMVYRFNGIPEKFIWKSETGHKIELSEKIFQDHGENVIQEDHILLETKTGKKILIDDGVGPEFSRILLDDGYGNFIKIQTDQDYHTGQNSINVEAIGNVHVTSKTGEIFISVEKGSCSPIEIRNYGSSSIDITCDSQDVNVFAGKDINAYAASGHVSIEASGNIEAQAHGNVEITAVENVNISGLGGDVVIDGVSLVNHTHSNGHHGADTDPPIK